MILPSKHLAQERSLLTLGAQILRQLDRPRTVSELWNEVKVEWEGNVDVPFDWFVLSLDLLAIVQAVYLDGNNHIRRGTP